MSQRPNIAIVTDSTSYLPEAVLAELDIHMVSLQVVFEDESLPETQISLPEFYERLKQPSQQHPGTSQPVVGEILELYERLSQDYEYIISIHLSSGISGTTLGAMTAASMLQEPAATVDVFDSEFTCYAQGFMAIEAAEMAKNGHSRESILRRLEVIRNRVQIYFLADDLQYLYRGGRLNAAQLLAGTVLQVKPILTFKEKRIVPFEKVRTRKNAKRRIMDMFEQDAKLGQMMRVSIVNANCSEEGEEWAAYIRNQYPHAQVNLSNFGPVIGTHLGPNAIGMTWYLL